MASGDTGALFPGYKVDAIEADTDLLAGDIRWMACGSANAKTITGATNATPISVTCASHGYSTGDIVMINGVGGNTNANGVFRVTNTGTDTFTLQDPITDANIAGNGAYTSGGRVINLTQNDFENDLTSIVATTSAVSSKASSIGVKLGYFDHADVTFTAVSGADIYYMIMKKHTGVTSTSQLIAIFCSWSTAPYPIVPNTGDINLQINTNGVFSF